VSGVFHRGEAVSKNGDPLPIEGVKLLKDWSVWMVTVETAVIALLGSGYLRDGGHFPRWGQVLAVCFALSIASAAEVLSALPWVVLRQGEPGFENFYQAPISHVPIRRHVRVWMVAVAQHVFFCAGLAAMVLGICGLL
jgi:hypothetical protein